MKEIKSPDGLLDAATTCILRRVVGDGHPLSISTSIQVCPLPPVVLSSQSKLRAEGRQEGGGYVSHAASSLLAEVWVPMNTHAEHVGEALSGWFLQGNSCPAKSLISPLPSSSRVSHTAWESRILLHPQSHNVWVGLEWAFLGNHSSSGLLCPCSVLLPVLQSLQLSPRNHRGLYPIDPQALHRQCHCRAVLHKGCGEVLFI